jgi:hypothetical protein
MARFVEPIVINGINKDVAPNGLDYSGRRVINPVRDVLNGRYFSSESDEEFQVENIKGTEKVTDILAKRSLLKNSEFNGTINPWVNMGNTGPSDVSWVHNGSGAVTISSSSASVINTKILAQGITGGFISGTEINIDISATILSGFSGGLILFGYFYNASDNIIQSFSIGVVPSGGSTALLNTNKTVPSGAVKIGIAFSANPGGVSSVLYLNRFKVNGFSTSMPDGINECIGTYENIEKNILIFFNWNSNGLHGVFKYDAVSDSITQLVSEDPSVPVLNFSNNPRCAITGIGMIGDILTWTDNLNPQRYINITKDYGFTFNDFTISLIKIGPRDKPTIVMSTSDKVEDNSISQNKIADNSFQFAFRYVYFDNEISVLSPYSFLLMADSYADDRIFNNKRNRCLVTHPIDSDVSQLVKTVELCFRIGNDAQWRIWKKVSSFGSSISEYFYNDSPGEVIPASYSDKIFDSVPNISKALALFKNRIFLNINEEGFDAPQTSITVALGSSVDTTQTTGIRPFIKKNGSYSVGIVASDKFNRYSGVYVKTKLIGPGLSMAKAFNMVGLGSDASNKSGYRFNVTISGKTIPDGRYSIVLTPDNQYSEYMQIPAAAIFYTRERENVDAPTNGPYYYIDEKVYVKKSSVNSAPWSYVYFMLPSELPFVPTKDHYIRIVNSENQSIVEKIIDIFDGRFIVTGKFSGIDFGSFNGFPIVNFTSSVVLAEGSFVFIEVFKPKSVSDIFYHEITGPYASNSSGDPLTTSIQDIEGDTFYRGGLKGASEAINLNWRSFRFAPAPLTSQQGICPITETTALLVAEMPAPLYISGNLADTKIPGLLGLVGTGNQFTQKSYTPNYAKSAWSKGRAFVETKEGIIYRPSTIRFSDIYIEGSNINGLNSFPVENIYDKIGQDRSPITKLIAVGTIMLAVHERNITTLYIGEGIVKTGETGFLTKVDAVIGDDRKLQGNYGSYHPESVQEVDGMAFGFDIFNGVVWRYTVEGLYAVSDNGMKNFFRDKARDYFESKDDLRFISSIDKYHKEYIITLPNKYDVLDTNGPLDISGTSGSFDIPFNDDFEVGKIYRLRIILLKQSNTGNNRVNVDVLIDGDPLKENIEYNVFTTEEDEAFSLNIEFLYSGEEDVTINVSGVTIPIFLLVYREYQEIEGETWAFNYEKKMWSHRTSIVPEFMGRIGNKVYAFKEGYIHKLNVNNIHNNFLGRQFERSFSVECNPRPNEVKVWSALQIAAEALCDDEASAYKVFDCENNQGQASYTRAKEFEKKEGVYYAPILKDVNTNPLLIGAGRIALRDGKDMRSKSLSVTIRNDRTDRCLLQKVNLIGEKSEFST